MLFYIIWGGSLPIYTAQGNIIHVFVCVGVPSLSASTSEASQNQMYQVRLSYPGFLVFIDGNKGPLEEDIDCGTCHHLSIMAVLHIYYHPEPGPGCVVTDRRHLISTDREYFSWGPIKGGQLGSWGERTMSFLPHTATYTVLEGTSLPFLAADFFTGEPAWGMTSAFLEAILGNDAFFYLRRNSKTNHWINHAGLKNEDLKKMSMFQTSVFCLSYNVKLNNNKKAKLSPRKTRNHSQRGWVDEKY